MEVLGSRPVSWVCDRKALQRPQRVQLNLTSPWGWCQACHQHEWLLFSFGSCSYTAFFFFSINKKNKKPGEHHFQRTCSFGCLLIVKKEVTFSLTKEQNRCHFWPSLPPSRHLPGGCFGRRPRGTAGGSPGLLCQAQARRAAHDGGVLSAHGGAGTTFPVGRELRKYLTR